MVCDGRNIDKPSQTVILFQDCVLGGPNDSQFLSSSVSTGGGDSAIDIPHSSMLNSGSFASVRRAQSQGSLQSSSQARDSSYTYFNV